MAFDKDLQGLNRAARALHSGARSPKFPQLKRRADAH